MICSTAVHIEVLLAQVLIETLRYIWEQKLSHFASHSDNASRLTMSVEWWFCNTPPDHSTDIQMSLLAIQHYYHVSCTVRSRFDMLHSYPCRSRGEQNITPLV